MDDVISYIYLQRQLKPNCDSAWRVTICLNTRARAHTAISSTVTITYNTVIVLSLFRQVVLPDHGWEADRYEGDVEGNKAITGWLYRGDVTYGAPPARCEGCLSPAGRCFIALLFTVAVISRKGQQENGEAVMISTCDRVPIS